MRKKLLIGKVVSGSGEGGKFTELPWVKKQITEKLGFSPFPGTLNIKLNENSLKVKKALEKLNLVEISPQEGFCKGKCIEACFMNQLKCAIVIPKVENYPEDLIEIVAPVNLRDKFQLRDGDTVEVEVLF